MGLSLFEQVVHEHPSYVHRLSADQFEQMIAAGVLPEDSRYELIDGLLVRKDRSAEGADAMTHGERHATAIELLTELYGRLRLLNCYARFQLPIRLSDQSAPEPDGAILRGEPSRGRGGHPTIGDVVAVVEVADSSLDYDRCTKQAMYAAAKIPGYVIINLRDSWIEVYTQPDASLRAYRVRHDFKRGEAFELQLADDATLTVQVDELLP